MGYFDPSLVPLGFARLFLAFLVLLPLGWLLAFSLTDESGAPSWANFAELGDPSLFLGADGPAPPRSPAPA